jgi:hypothetical protein
MKQPNFKPIPIKNPIKTHEQRITDWHYYARINLANNKIPHTSIMYKEE